ncbi:hypothetical protein LINPERHAP1_LOCUS37605 [Linum perenne]
MRYRINPTSATNINPNFIPPVPPIHNHPRQFPPPGIPHRNIHCDGSFLNESQKAGYDIVVSNAEGKVTDGRAGTFHCSYALVAEAKAIYEAAHLAESSDQVTTIFSDCLNLVNAIRGPKSRWPWECFGLLGEITIILQSRPNIQLSFISRRLNARADLVARNVRSGSLLPNWIVGFDE